MFRNPTPRPIIRWTLLLAVPLILTGWVDLAFAKEKSIFSPIIHVNKQKGFIVVSTDSGVIGVAVSKEAKRHLGKLPAGAGMIDMVVEMRNGKPPLLKSWKVVAGESACKHFDGKRCR